VDPPLDCKAFFSLYDAALKANGEVGERILADIAQTLLRKDVAEISPRARPGPDASCVETRVANEKRCLLPKDNFRDCPECPEMVVVPAGTFPMGSPASEDVYTIEGPQHDVTITRPFAVGKYEVTFAEWDACVAAGGCRYKPSDSGKGRGRMPVIDVSWDQITGEYIPWLNRRTGETYRLLTVAEWEYAARAGSQTRFHFGNIERDLCTYANFADLTAKEKDKDWPAAKTANCRDGYLFTALVWARSSPTPSGFTTCTAMWRSSCRTAGTQAMTVRRPTVLLGKQATVGYVSCAEAPGAVVHSLSARPTVKQAPAAVPPTASGSRERFRS
jgi:hypothetical protein